MKSQSIAASVFLFISLFFGLTAATAQEEREVTKDLLSPRLIAVKFHADWCTECKRMADIIIDLQNRMEIKKSFENAHT